mgnify:CR=1 FL=1
MCRPATKWLERKSAASGAGEARSESPAPDRVRRPPPRESIADGRVGLAISPTGGGESLNPLSDPLYWY